MSYRYEMHLHSCGCSKCGASPSTDYIAAAKKLGYAGMVFTNHFYHGNTGVDRNLPWRDFVNAYRDDYLRAKEVGDREGIDVLFGIEEAYRPGKEVLIYGVEPEMVAETPEFRDMTLAEISAFTHGCGGFIVCAHPFRAASYIPDPDTPPDPTVLDAVEICNAHNFPDDDEKAAAFAARENLPGICGGDVHNVTRFGCSGLDFEERVWDNKTLVRLLKSGKYTMFLDRVNK